MSDTGVAPGAAVDMPVPFGVEAETGATRPPLTEQDLGLISGDPQSVLERSKKEAHLAIVPTIDGKNLADAGWGIVFPATIDPAIKAALQPLIELRQKQANVPGHFKIFEGNRGVKPGQSAVDWLDRQGVGLAVVDPDNGVPYYLLLVGSPQQIPFEFQFTLDLQWCVGRVYFDTAAEYEAYARAVVEYETAAKPPNKKRAAMWMTRNPGDTATTLLTNQVGRPFIQQGLGSRRGFQLASFMDAQATKPQLADILRGKATGGPPAVLFTGSHGLEWSSTDLEGQRKNQGAIVTQEWMPGVPAKPDQYFAADDVPADSNVLGTIHFQFACFGGGCPKLDNYRTNKDGSPIQLTADDMIAKLPQRLLSKGALAVFAHVDRAWNWSFQTGSGLPQNQVIRSTLDALMLGLRAGQATDFFNLQWSTMAARLGMLQGQRGGANPPSPASLVNLFIARDDARNYALLGDPAVRLRVEEMES
jgi:hypothetical protein